MSGDGKRRVVVNRIKPLPRKKGGFAGDAIRPATAAQLSDIDGLPAKLRDRQGEALVATINAPDEAGGFKVPKPPSREQRSEQKQLAVRVSQLADALSLEPELIATRQEIGTLVRGEVPSRLASGWRRDLLLEARVIEGSAGAD